VSLGLAGQWFLVLVGCAERGDSPLVIPHGLYDNALEAQAAAGPSPQAEWVEHPRGGFIRQTSDGAAWCAPVEVLGLIEDPW
jgi:hypothetical protein